MRYSIELGEESATGVRDENQDRVAHFETPFGFVAMVADGMGGHRGGAVASSMAAARLPQLLSRLPRDCAPDEALAQAIGELNREILAAGEAHGEQEGMGSTLAALLVWTGEPGPLAITAHVGDSRIYFLRGGRLYRLTQDHTMVQEMVASGALTAEQAWGHPQAHVLTRALGHGENLAVDLGSWMLLLEGDRFVLCSDGVSGYLPDDEIRNILAADAEPGELARRLVRAAFDSGSEDNLSAVVVRIAPESPDARP
jgi:protein phosphatase